MRVCLSFILTLGASISALAQGLPAGWIADPQTGCRVWNNYPSPDDRIKWEGPCVDGYADGTGTTKWFSKGEIYETDSGQFKKGKADGNVVVMVSRGRFEGEFRNNRPNGAGTFTAADGKVYAGVWTNGCFRQGDRKMTFFTTAKECGF